MSLKTKLTSLITTFVLLCSLLTVGVFAVKNTTFNVGGNIEFNVQGIEASITRDNYAGFVTTNDKTIGDAEGNVLRSFTLDNTMSADQVSSKLAPWSGLKLAFNEATTATINLTIKNEAQAGADNFLDISAIASATTKNNARVSVVNDAGGVTALLQPQQSASFTITFSVIDDEYSANLEGFSVNFDMQKKVLADFPKVESIEDKEDLLDQYEFSEFSTEAPYTVTIGAKGASEMNYTTTLSGDDIVVPDYVNKDGNIYAVTKLAEGAFGHGGPCETFNYTSLTLPKTLTTFGGYCVYTDNAITIDIPYGVTSIGDYAFYFCPGLTSITIPESVERIGEDAFSCCSSLTSIEIPSSVTSIGKSAFNTCDKLISITIPSSVTSIGDYAFNGCGSLTNIIIPSSVTSIGDRSFRGCADLTSLVVESGNSVYDSRNNCNAIIETATNTLILGCQNTIIPESVERIGEDAFSCCSSLTSIEIPSSVTSIGDYAFNGCPGLTSIEIPSSVTSIGEGVFYGCRGLTSITIPSSVTSIGESAFNTCDGLKNVNYTGTQEQWNALLENIGSNNEDLLNATLVPNYTGE